MVTEGDEAFQDVAYRELEKFRKITWVRNHWARMPSPRTYYWYLTFEDCTELHGLVEQCRSLLSVPYYDPTPQTDLHLTIDRVAHEQDVPPSKITAIEAAALRACRRVREFELTIGALGGTATAVGFRAVPDDPTRHLRDVLRRATISVHPEAPVKISALHPHVGIAYSNSDAPALEAVAAVERLSTLRPVTVAVRRVALVLLEQYQRSYSWRTVAHIPLAKDHLR